MTKRNLGKWLENIIENVNKAYRYTGAAVIEKQEVQTKQRYGQMVYSKKGAPDFLGVIEGGRAVAFDAKATRQNYLPLNTILKRPHQLEYLTDYEKVGGIAFYLVGLEAAGRFFAVPVSQVREAVERADSGGRKSIPLEELQPHEVFSSLHYNLDYLRLEKKQEKQQRILTEAEVTASMRPGETWREWAWRNGL